MDNQLLIENLTKSFGSTHVLSEINLTIPLGAFTSILGPSGSGKTTLLMVLAGIEKATKGRIIFGDEDLFGEILDVILHPVTVLLGESCCRGDPRQQLLLAGLHQRNLAPTVLGLLRRVRIGRRTQQYHSVEQVGVAFAEGQGHVAAHGVPDDRAAGDSQRTDGIGHGVGQKLHRVLFALDDGDAVPGDVERHDAHLLI